MTDAKEFVALMSLDWADKWHVGCLQTVGFQEIERFQLEQKAGAIEEWVGELRARFKGGKIAVAVEQKRGALIYALMKYELFAIFPLNTTAVKNYRKALRASGAKDDSSDAEIQLRFLRTHLDHLKRWQPDDLLTRQLRLLVETRRKVVNQSTVIGNQLTALLKEYYPTALEMVGKLKSQLTCDFLKKWPDLTTLKGVKPERLRSFYYKRNCRSRAAVEYRIRTMQAAVQLIEEQPIINVYRLMLNSLVDQLQVLLKAIEQFDRKIELTFEQHPDLAFYKSLPSAGRAIAPRLAAFFGEDRNKFDSPVAVANLSGVAPVTLQSGKRKTVVFRLGAPKFARQSLVEFALHSIRSSIWARAYYKKCRAEGKNHQAAIRALAYKWIRILYRCWKDRISYNEDLYLQALRKRKSPLADLLNCA